MNVNRVSMPAWAYLYIRVPGTPGGDWMVRVPRDRLDEFKEAARKAGDGSSDGFVLLDELDRLARNFGAELFVADDDMVLNIGGDEDE